LDDNQEQVIKAVNGHYIVLAGPGCGKTHTITEKIAYIFHKKVVPEPYKLLAVTFTDNAARLMRTRLRSKGFIEWDRIWIGTYHSFALSILKAYGSDVGIREDFEIIEKSERDKLIEDIVRKYYKYYLLKDIISQFERLKREGVDTRNEEAWKGRHESDELRHSFKEYNAVLRERNQVDFGDLILFSVILLKNSTLAKRVYTQTFRYVIVDEFQDSDSQQLEMICILSKSAIGSTIVGDDDQSIFGWRGALRQNIDKIKGMLGATEIILSSNFRSDEVIIEAAQRVIQIDPDRRKKNIKAISMERGRLYGYAFDDTAREAKYVAKQIQNILQKRGPNELGEIAIIARTHYRAEPLIEALTENSVPWFDRWRFDYKDSWETTLALGCIALSQDPTASLPLNWVMTAIEDGGLAYYLGEQDALEVARNIRDRIKNGLGHLQGNENTLGLITEIIKEIIKKTALDEMVQRTNNIEKMIECIRGEVEKRGMGLMQVAERFLGHGAVQIISGHEAKGSEFDTIFFVGLEDGIIPDYRSCADVELLAEERRVFYVCLTRAKKVACLSYARHKMTKLGIIDNKPSRFLLHIPREFFTGTNIA